MNKKIEPYVRVPHRISKNPDISPIAKTVLLAIASYKPSFPSYEQIKRNTGIGSSATISKALKELEQLGIIKKVRGGYNRSNDYYVYMFTSDIEQCLHKLNLENSHNEHQDIQNLNANKSNLNILNKSEDSSATTAEEPLVIDEIAVSIALKEMINELN